MSVDVLVGVGGAKFIPYDLVHEQGTHRHNAFLSDICRGINVLCPY